MEEEETGRYVYCADDIGEYLHIKYLVRGRVQWYPFHEEAEKLLDKTK